MSHNNPIPVNARDKFIQYMELYDDPELSDRKRFEALEEAAAKFCNNHGLRYANTFHAADQYLRMKAQCPSTPHGHCAEDAQMRA